MSRRRSSWTKPTFCAAASRSSENWHTSRRTLARASVSLSPAVTVIDAGANRPKSFVLDRPLAISLAAPDWKYLSRSGPAFRPSGAFDEKP